MENWKKDYLNSIVKQNNVSDTRKETLNLYMDQLYDKIKEYHTLAKIAKDPKPLFKDGYEESDINTFICMIAKEDIVLSSLIRDKKSGENRFNYMCTKTHHSYSDIEFSIAMKDRFRSNLDYQEFVFKILLIMGGTWGMFELFEIFF